LSTDENTLGRFGRPWLVIAKFVSLYAYAHDFALVDVQTLHFGGIKQFVS
jgi:hypothetical protein